MRPVPDIPSSIVAGLQRPFRVYFNDVGQFTGSAGNTCNLLIRGRLVLPGSAEALEADRVHSIMKHKNISLIWFWPDGRTLINGDFFVDLVHKIRIGQLTGVNRRS